ncbi:hypothetical protein C8J56DRAFT_1159400 [Mycena floridula]|nr:hypothetical protein C8J56DRAFT_1159400 [Mycena floridula]
MTPRLFGGSSVPSTIYLLFSILGESKSPSIHLPELDDALEAVARLEPMPTWLRLVLPGGSKAKHWLSTHDVETSSGRVECRLNQVSQLTLDTTERGVGFDSHIFLGSHQWLELFPALEDVIFSHDALGGHEADFQGMMQQRCPRILMEMLSDDKDSRYTAGSS